MPARSSWIAIATASLAFLLVGCLRGGGPSCADGRRCPSDEVCDDLHKLCIAPQQIAACNGAAAGALCSYPGVSQGTCVDGVCFGNSCGNGNLNPGEACDGTVGVDPKRGESCSPDCKKIWRCGDGVVDPGEPDQCDDGNQNPADGCDLCRLTAWRAKALVGSAVHATDASVATPHGVAVDRTGRIFIADTGNNTIRRIDTDGTITTIAGTTVAGYSGDGGPATSAELSHPRGVAVDGLGRVYIADSDNDRIRRVEADGTISTVVGTAVSGFSGDGGLARAAALNEPMGVAVDGIGRLYIADTANEVIRLVDLDETIRTIAGSGRVQGNTGDGGLATDATLNYPSSLALDREGGVLVADTGNDRVRRFDVGGVITTVAGTGTRGYSGDGGPATSAQIFAPSSVAVDAEDRVLIADQGNNRVRRIEGQTITTIAGTGLFIFNGDDQSGTRANLDTPTGVAITPQDEVVIADTFHNRVRRLSVGAVPSITTIAGGGQLGPTGAAELGTSVQLASPQGLAIDGNGNLFVADTSAHSILRVDSSGITTTIAGGRSIGDFGGDGGSATAASLQYPTGIVLDALGRVVFSDTGNYRVRRIDIDGTIRTLAGDGTPGYGGDNGPATSAQMNRPMGLVIDSSGRVLIADTYNYRIRRIELDGTITTVAGNGTVGFMGDGGPAVAAELASPNAIALDGSGGLLIADGGNGRIRRVARDGTIATVAGGGSSPDDGVPATSAALNLPNAVTVDRLGRMLILERGSDRIRRVELDGTIHTIAGSVKGNSGDAGPALLARLDVYQHFGGPLRLAHASMVVDGVGNLLVTDTSNQRVRRISNDPIPIITTVAGAIDPDGVGPIQSARLATSQQIVVANGMALSAGGPSGTLEAIRDGRVEVVAGRYPQDVATGMLARYRASSFGSVGGVALDPASGNIFLSETSSNVVHVVTPIDAMNPLRSTIAPLAKSGFLSPSGLFFDATSHALYVADTGNHAIQEIELGAGDCVATASCPQRTVVNGDHRLGYFGDGGDAQSASLFQPSAVTRCPNGNLFIADTGNERVRRVDASSGIISTVLGDGVASSSGEGRPSSSFSVNTPRGLACDDFGNVFVTSTTTLRMLAASDAHVVDGSGEVQTIYPSPAAPRTQYPATETDCLAGVAVTGATTIQVADACTGILVELTRGLAQ